MTTMFVQLRRMVYLLVLLHFCVSLVSATVSVEGASGPDGGEVVVVKRTEHDEVLSAENVTAAWLIKAGQLLEEGVGCFSVWEDELRRCRESANRTEAAANETTDYVNEKKGALKPVESEVGTKIKELVEGVKNAVIETTAAVKDVKRIKDTCTDSLGSMVDALTFNATREYYMGERLEEKNKTYWTLEKKKLAEISNWTFYKLSNVTGELGALVGKNKILFLWDLVEHMKAAKTKMDGVKQAFQPSGDDSEITRSVEEVLSLIAKVVPITKQNALITKTESTIDDKLRDAKAKARQRIAEEVKAKEEQARKEEAARQEREKQTRLEEQRLAKEKERMAQEELERKRMAEEQAKKKKAADEEAEKRKDDEKRDQEEKAKQEQERRDAEEKARVALEKKEKEQLERAAEEARKKAEATKKNDNSHSPSLVHSPLFLLLLCVLGSTLVC
ncbi:uncharacterized protein TM35_001741000 [Trypanosoma theileri]|uniref:Trypanosoma glutamic acid/alanine-rich protein domain-containing protein n=1 Tax=Trypanosoma theileri TaxID=67003 RepID=A0A1X0NDU7_9TRYP|nr:uncharacterized protein TM35_001741000 [Trypanosoma theileri]ORC80209.1 hypothetical protein TM35_001741000 [Trypanosoma theileri]